MDSVTTDGRTNKTLSCTFIYRSPAQGVEQTPKPPYQGNIPRVTRLMALALRFDKLLRGGVVENYAELATLGHVSRPRITQIMALLNLSPTIISELLDLPATIHGRDVISERDLRPIYGEIFWEEQERQWGLLVNEKISQRSS